MVRRYEDAIYNLKMLKGRLESIEIEIERVKNIYENALRTAEAENLMRNYIKTLRIKQSNLNNKMISFIKLIELIKEEIDKDINNLYRLKEIAEKDKY